MGLCNLIQEKKLGKVPIFMDILAATLPLLAMFLLLNPVELVYSSSVFDIAVTVSNYGLKYIPSSLLGGLMIGIISFRGKTRYWENLTYEVEVKQLPAFYTVAMLFSAYSSVESLGVILSLSTVSTLCCWYLRAEIIKPIAGKKITVV